MAPIASESTTQLLKRAYYYNYNRTRNRPWWIVLCVVIPVLFLFLIYCALQRRRNIRRHQQGLQPTAYTNWTMYGYNPNQQTQQPVYNQQQNYDNNYGYKPEGQYDNQYYPPTYGQNDYQRPEGPPPTTGNNTDYDNTYQRPEGPPPSSTTYPTYPSQTHTKA